MAIVSVFSTRIQDIAGKTDTTIAFLPSGLTLAQIQAWSDAYLGALDDVTAGQIMQATISLGLTLPAGLKVAPMGGQYVNLGANVGFDVADSNYRHTVRVPAIREALLSGDNLDIADAAVVAWAGLLSAGDGTVAPTNEFGLDLSTLLSGVATFHK